jgi:hypothetical protein
MGIESNSKSAPREPAASKNEGAPNPDELGDFLRDPVTETVTEPEAAARPEDVHASLEVLQEELARLTSESLQRFREMYKDTVGEDCPANDAKALSKLKEYISGVDETTDKALIEHVFGRELPELLDVEHFLRTKAFKPGSFLVAQQRTRLDPVFRDQLMVRSRVLRDEVVALSMQLEKYKPLTDQEVNHLATAEGVKWVRVAGKVNRLSSEFFVYNKQGRRFDQRMASSEDMSFGYYHNGVRIWPTILGHSAQYTEWVAAMRTKFGNKFNPDASKARTDTADAGGAKAGSSGGTREGDSSAGRNSQDRAARDRAERERQQQEKDAAEAQKRAAEELRRQQEEAARAKQEADMREQIANTIEAGKSKVESVLQAIDHVRVKTLGDFEALANNDTRDPFNAQDLQRVFRVFGALGSSYTAPLFFDKKKDSVLHDAEIDAVGRVKGEIDRLRNEKKDAEMLQSARESVDPAELAALDTWADTEERQATLHTYLMYSLRNKGRREMPRFGAELKAYDDVQGVLRGYRSAESSRESVTQYSEDVKDAWFGYANVLLGPARVDKLVGAIDAGRVTSEEYYQYMCMVGQYESLTLPITVFGAVRDDFKKVSDCL